MLKTLDEIVEQVRLTMEEAWKEFSNTPVKSRDKSYLAGKWTQIRKLWLSIDPEIRDKYQ